MNFYKTLIILSFLASITNFGFLYQLRNEPKVIAKTEIIRNEIPKIEVAPQINLPKQELSDTDKIFLEALFNKTVNLTIDNTRHVLSDDLFVKEPVKAKVVK